jgi:hypothetical protein
LREHDRCCVRLAQKPSEHLVWHGQTCTGMQRLPC